jgi:hypothetical protein
MEYKQNIKEVINRLTKFYNREMQDRIIVRAGIQPKSAEKHKGMDDYQHANIKDIEPDIKFKDWDCALKGWKEMSDDTVPTAYPYIFDGGIWGGVLGASTDINISGNGSSANHPIDNFYNLIDKFEFDNNNIWVTKFIDYLEYYKKHAEGKFGVGQLMTCNALNFVSSMKGSAQAIYDVIDRPDDVKRAMKFGVDLCEKICKIYRKIIGTYENGVFGGYNEGWFPHKTCYLSVDVYCYWKPGTYTAMGFSYQQELIDRIGYGFMHTHGNGRFLLPEIVKHHNLIAIELNDDGADRPSFEILREIKEITREIPVIVNVGFDDFRDALENNAIVGGTAYNIWGIPNMEESVKLCERAKKYIAKTV